MTDDTRTRILDAAESVFAERGYDGTSIREIVRAAGVNVAAVHYHFGSKESVLRGLTDRVAQPISARRAELLEATKAAAQPGQPDLASLVEAFVRADIEVLLELQERGPKTARFLGRVYGDQTPWIRQMAADQYRQANSFLPLFAAELPQLTADELQWRIGRLVAIIVDVFSTWPLNGMSAEEAESLLGRLVAFLTAGLGAPSTSRAPRAPRPKVR